MARGKSRFGDTIMKKQILCSAAAMALTFGAALPSGLQAQAMGSMGGGKSAMMGTEAPAKVYGDLFKMVSGEIISAAEAMPADKYDFAPPASAGSFDGVRTFAGQVNHLIGANYYFFSGFGMTPPVTKEQIAAMKTKDQLVQGLKDSFAFMDKGVASITPQNAFVIISKSEEGNTRAGAATFALAHANDHYGQMVEYLRMNGIVPPASQKK
jgi:uncharacterized damage-inducible protein DinB